MLSFVNVFTPVKVLYLAKISVPEIRNNPVVFTSPETSKGNVGVVLCNPILFTLFTYKKDVGFSLSLDLRFVI